MVTLNASRPTIAWREQMNLGNKRFTLQAIIDSDRLLYQYVSALNVIKNEIEIWDAIEAVVKGFDELNIKHNYFIETMEREYLAEFIQYAAETVGLRYDGDVTEEWRMEW